MGTVVTGWGDVLRPRCQYNARLMRIKKLDNARDISDLVTTTINLFFKVIIQLEPHDEQKRAGRYVNVLFISLNDLIWVML